MKELSQEWCVLQNQYDQFEKYALLTKLFSIVILLLGLTLALSGMVLIALMLVLWGQEAIWKTFQSRTEERLIVLEQGISKEHGSEVLKGLVAFQFNSEFLAHRANTIGLFKEYAQQAMRPTVAFPYVVLLIIAIISFMG